MRKIIICSALLCAMLCAANAAVGDEYTYEETVTKNIVSVSIEWTSGEVVILPHNESYIKLVQTASREISGEVKMRVFVSGRTLEIKDNRYGNQHFFDSKKNNYFTAIAVFLPVAHYNEIAIDVVSAQVEISTVDVDAIDIESVSGDITLKNVSPRELTCEVVSGNIEAKGSFYTVDVESVSGEIQIESNSIPTQFDAETVSGRITLSIPEGNGFSLRFSKVSGGVHSDFPLVKQGGEQYTYGNGGANFRVEAVSGGFYIYKL